MIGKVHSLQSLGAVDGPGLRYVVFLQGCPLRCAYCHNPDTWHPHGGRAMSVEELVTEILRYRDYFGDQGGVTVTGGEPLMQGEFVAELFFQLHKQGIHTALDTCGHGTDQQIDAVLAHTDLVLCDVKFTDEQAYRQYSGGSLKQVLHFLDKTATNHTDVWIRHVVVPNLTDSAEGIEQLNQLLQGYTNIKKVELLPFRKLCQEKYDQMGIVFPLAQTPACTAETINRLQQLLRVNGI